MISTTNPAPTLWPKGQFNWLNAKPVDLREFRIARTGGR